jgi:hypothetical protein
MVRTNYLLVVAAVCLIVAATYSLGEPLPPNAVSVKQFGRNRVIGHLGVPLGTIVRITGTCISGDTTQRRADMGKTLLRIETVNGTVLEPQFDFSLGRATNGVAKPRPGDRVDFYVHEWGSFDGIVDVPKGLGIAETIVAHDGFRYRPELTIHEAQPKP